MKEFIDRIKQEPVAFQAVIQMGLAMFVSFGLGLSGEQTGAIMAFTAAILAFFTRQHVTSNSETARQVGVALNTPVPEREEKEHVIF